MFCFNAATIPPVVAELSDELSITYKVRREESFEEDWPPTRPSSIVSLALMHYHDMRTDQGMICKEGASEVDNLAATLSNVTKKISRIFEPESDSKQPKRILIEGAPGIGKTVLAKEIAYEWASGKILIKCKLLFLLFFRNPSLSKVESIDEILKLFTRDVSNVKKYVLEGDGINVTFVLDGFDEYPSALQKQSFIKNLITGEVFINSTVLVTSRPTATFDLHNKVDRRIEILGLPREERKRYITLSFSDAPDKKQQLQRYLKRNPIIEKLCYIPLYLSILTYLCQENRLPDTLTKVNESFIISTIYRYLEKSGLCGRSYVMPKTLDNLPSNVLDFVKKLSRLAFEGLDNDQLIFTIDSIKKVCPDIDDIPGAINGFGLLQAVQHCPLGGGSTTSVNFLHFTMQEYLAAFYVSNLPEEEQSSLMSKTFWDSQFSFMWMMYIGIVKSRGVFMKFITSNTNVSGDTPLEIKNNIQMDKRKCLYLFQCYTEAKISREMPKVISSLFSDGKIILTNTKLSSHHISSLVFFMSTVGIQRWKTLELARCSLSNVEMKSLLNYFDSQNENMSMLQLVDLSENGSSPWGVYCAIIKLCHVNSLALCGDKGMKQYVEEISDSLQKNTNLHSVTLFKIGGIGIQSIEDVLSSNTTLKKLNVSWESKGTTIIHRKFTHSELSSTKTHQLHSYAKVVDINILFDGDHERSSEVITMSNKGINDDAVYVITFGLYNNTTVQKLDLSYNKITDHGVVALSNCLRSNNTLTELNLSNNLISSGGMSNLTKCFKHATVLKYIDLSENKLSPWDVYCTIIRHSRVNSLTFCGDEGMKYYEKKIKESLQANTTLESLTLCKIGRTGLRSTETFLCSSTTVKKINMTWQSKGRIIVHRQLTQSCSTSHEKIMDINILYDGDHECSPEVINMSNKNINDDAVYLITFGLYNNTTVKKLDLSCNRITDKGVIAISEYLKCNNALKELNLSKNCIWSEGMSNLAKCINNATALEYVDLSENLSSPWLVYCTVIRHSRVTSLTLCGDEGIEEYVGMISNNLQTNIALCSLTLFKIGRVGIRLMKEVLGNNVSFTKLNLSWNSKGTTILQRKYTYGEFSLKGPHLLQSSEGYLLQDYPKVKDNYTKVVDINILFDGDHERSSEVISMSNKGINDDAVYVIAFGLYNNSTVQKLDLSCNHITDDGVFAISNCLKSINMLKELNLSQNCISTLGMNNLSECIKQGTLLEYVDLSENKSSPWGVYCAIIRHCSVYSLTLCGDEEMEKYVPEISDSLKINTTLHSITLFKIGRIGVHSMKTVLHNKATLNLLKLSWNSKGTTILSRKFTYKSNVRALDVVDISILYDGDHECSAEVVNMSNKDINDDAVYVITFGLYNNATVKKLDLSCNCITDDGVIAIRNCLKFNKTLTELNLSKNLISYEGMSTLTKCVKKTKPLNYIDLSENKSSPWDVYCAVIKHWRVHNLTLCGDEGMEDCVQEISASLEINRDLRSLTLFKIGKIGIQSVNGVLDTITTLRKLDMSWNSKGTTILHRKFRLLHGYADVNILYDGDHECSAEVFTMSDKGINDDAVYLIAFGLYNNTTVTKLDLSFNCITDDGVVAISNYLKFNNTLKELNLSKNLISSGGMSNLGEYIKHATALEYVDLSENKSSQWGVYCTIIGHSCVNNLTLCGDEGMKHYVQEIVDSLKINRILHSITLFKIGRIGVQSMKGVLDNNTTLEKLNMSWNNKGTTILQRKFTCKSNMKRPSSLDINILFDGDHECSAEVINMSNKGINDDAVCLITFGLYNNTTVQKLDLSFNKITDDGVVAITEYLKTNNTIQDLNLSCNAITREGATQIADVIMVNGHLRKLDVSHNPISDNGVMYISYSLKQNNTLLELNLSSTGITDNVVDNIAGAIQEYSLQNLDLSQNDISYEGKMYMHNKKKATLVIKCDQ